MEKYWAGLGHVLDTWLYLFTPKYLLYYLWARELSLRSLTEVIPIYSPSSMKLGRAIWLRNDILVYSLSRTRSRRVMWLRYDISVHSLSSTGHGREIRTEHVCWCQWMSRDVSQYWDRVKIGVVVGFWNGWCI